MKSIIRDNEEKKKQQEKQARREMKNGIDLSERLSRILPSISQSVIRKLQTYLIGFFILSLFLFLPRFFKINPNIFLGTAIVLILLFCVMSILKVNRIDPDGIESLAESPGKKPVILVSLFGPLILVIYLVLNFEIYILYYQHFSFYFHLVFSLLAIGLNFFKIPISRIFFKKSIIDNIKDLKKIRTFRQVYVLIMGGLYIGLAIVFIVYGVIKNKESSRFMNNLLVKVDQKIFNGYALKFNEQNRIYGDWVAEKFEKFEEKAEVGNIDIDKDEKELMRTIKIYWKDPKSLPIFKHFLFKSSEIPAEDKKYFLEKFFSLSEMLVCQKEEEALPPDHLLAVLQYTKNFIKKNFDFFEQSLESLLMEVKKNERISGGRIEETINELLER